MSNNVRIENRDLELARDELIAKERKPYTITKQRERWTEEEHRKFIEAIKFHGRDWLRIEDHIGTKTAIQIRSHAQKFFSKLEQGSGLLHGIKVPPPRPKRKSTHPYPRKLSSAFSKEIKSAPIFFSRYSNPLGSPDICMSTHQKLLQLEQGSGLLHDIKVPSPRMKHKSTHPYPWKLASSFSKEIKSASNFFSRYGNPLGSPDICMSTHQKLLQDDASHAEGGTSSSSLLSSPSSLPLPLPLSPSSSLSLSKAIRCRMCHPHCACTHANAHENNGEPHETSVTWPTLESLMSSPNCGFNPWPPQKNLKRELELHTSTYPTIKTLEPPLHPLLRSTSPWPIPSSFYLQKTPHITTPHITTTHHFSVLEGSTGEIIIRNDGE